MPCLSRLRVQFASKLFLALALSHAAMACADAQAEVQRALVLRQQQSDEFALRLRQSQPMLKKGNLARRLEMLNLEQRQRLQDLNDQQLMLLQSSGASAEAAGDSTGARSGYQQQRFEQERQLHLQNFERERRQLQREQESSTDTPD